MKAAGTGGDDEEPLERVVPYSASTGVLLSGYLAHRAGISRARGPLFLSEPRRNHAQPLSLWTWPKVVRRIALEAGVERFSTHTTRHLCLTDLARMGWEVHAIATFAGHRHPPRWRPTRRGRSAWICCVRRPGCPRCSSVPAGA
nr:site-specific integrase [Streptomyces antimycoticus]